MEEADARLLKIKEVSADLVFKSLSEIGSLLHSSVRFDDTIPSLTD